MAGWVCFSLLKSTWISYSMSTTKGKYVHIHHWLRSQGMRAYWTEYILFLTLTQFRFYLRYWSAGEEVLTKQVFLRFLKFDIPFIFNFLLKYDVCTEVGTDHEYTAQWIFTNRISTGHGLDHQIKNRALAHVRAHLSSLGPLCTILTLPLTPFTLLISSRFLPGFIIPFILI